MLTGVPYLWYVLSIFSVCHWSFDFSYASSGRGNIFIYVFEPYQSCIAFGFWILGRKPFSLRGYKGIRPYFLPGFKDSVNSVFTFRFLTGCHFRKPENTAKGCCSSLIYLKVQYNPEIPNVPKKIIERLILKFIWKKKNAQEDDFEKKRNDEREMDKPDTKPHYKITVVK